MMSSISQFLRFSQVVILAISCFHAAAADDDIPVAEVMSASVPFVSLQEGYVTQRERYHRFRIPGLIVAPDGSVVVFAEGRRGNGGDPRTEANAPGDIVMRRSTDNGQTWEPLVVIDSGFRPDGALVDYGDPSPVLDATTGTLFLCYGQFPDRGPETGPPGQDPGADSGHHVVWIRRSTDNGRTWSDRQQIIYPDEPHNTSDGLYWRMAHPGPGTGIQLQWQDHNPSLNGRLVIPAKRRGSSMPAGPVTSRPFVFYSDDHGDTWHVGEPTLGPEADEDEVVELTDGRLLLDARQDKGTFRRRHVSVDGGQTWGPDIPDTITITPVDGAMVRYSARRTGHDRDRILFSGPRGIGHMPTRSDFGLTRNNMTVWTSYDEGKSFVNPVQINNEMAAYSVLQRLADGTIGLLVETASDDGATYGDITFYRFDMAQLEAAHQRD